LGNIRGRVFVLGDNVDTDQILPGYAMSAPVEELKIYALKGSAIPDFPERVQPGDIIIAGENFGCGSSREQAPVALKTAGVSAIIAKSFAIIFRKNAINIGLPVVIGYLVNEAQEGDILELDIENANAKNITQNKEYQLKRLSEITLETLRAGGLINKVRKILLRGD